MSEERTITSYTPPARKLSAAVVGLRMGLGHCGGLTASQCFELTAVCDIADEALRTAEGRYPGVRAFKDVDQMLRDVRPQVVVIATPNALHHAQAMAALASPGLHGLVLEKPMTLTLADARQIVETAEAKQVRVVVNHQRRTWPAFRTIKRLMDAGAIGTPQLIRASCAGDFLSDGTHLVDSVRFLAADAKVKSVVGQVLREVPDGSKGGVRFGHTTDTAAMAVVEFETGLRAELFTGDLQPRGRQYQDYEVVGTEGRIWRAGDAAALQVMLEDLTGGFRQVKLEPFDVPEHANLSLANVYVRHYQQIAEGRGNPMGGRGGLAAMEICTAVYESARLNRRILFPIDAQKQPVDPTRWTLDVMIEQGRF